LRAAFGPVIDRLAMNAIDLAKMPVEVAPIAHYHMGGVAADARMETEIPGLLVAGEAVGGANGANRLSGNAVTEALVFGRRAGRTAAARVARMTSQPFRPPAAAAALDVAAGDGAANGPNSADLIQRLQSVMADDVGSFRTKERLERAIERMDGLRGELGERPFGDGQRFDMRRVDWFDLHNMLLVARVVALAALRRTESRGAHQREDFPAMAPEWRVNQVARWREGEIEFVSAPPAQGLPPPYPPPQAGRAIAYGTAASAPSPLVAEGRDGGACRACTVVLHSSTPTPDPSPQGGAEQQERRATCDCPALAGEGREGETARLRVWRGLAPRAGQFESYEVPFEPGQSVLDGLRWIRANHDPTLAIRFSCINANACKECMMEIDGATVYACTTRLEPREMTVKPLSNKAPVRDLVTEIAPPAERLKIT